MRSNQKGFSAVEGILLLIIVGIIGFAGWFVYNSQKKASSSYNNAASASTTAGQTSQAKSNADFKTYTNKVGNFSVKYPSTWKEDTVNQTINPAISTSRSTLTSPTGTILKLESDMGGKGGACEPAATDKPFQAGNQCPSLEILSSEKLPVKNIYYEKLNKDSSGKISFSTQHADVVLITSHYSDSDGVSQYIVGLTNSTTQNPIELNKPEMGAIYSENLVSVYDSKGVLHPYIYAYSSSPSLSFLTSDDAVTIKTILRSIQIKL